MEKEIVGTIMRETIKPSSPTPGHLKTFKISLLDQLTPICYTPIIFFYPMMSDDDSNAHAKIEDKSARLKESLSKTLTQFYPLGGRIKDNFSIDCNDEGVSFFETQIASCLSEFLSEPEIELLDQFLPCLPTCNEPAEVAAQVAAQLTVFSCGGIAICVCFLHKIIDGTMMSAFIKTWAAISKGSFDYKTVCNADFLAGSSLFPQRELLPTHATMWLGSPFVEKEVKKSSSRRFVFDAKAISALKAKATSESVPNPTRVEALSGFIWKQVMEASRTASGSRKPAVLAHAVNLRSRMDPVLPQHSIGNIVWKAFACYEATGMEIELQGLVGLLRDSIAEIESGYVQKLFGDEGFGTISKWLEEVGEMYSKGRPDSYSFTSWCKMGFNEVDFGFGKPVWVCTGGFANAIIKNVVLLLETASGDDGIEAWFILDEHEMAILEQDPQFLTYATPNPSILLPSLLKLGQFAV